MLAGSPAHAATNNPYVPNNVCDGGGFVEVAKHPMAKATIFLLRSGYFSSRYCVVTLMNQVGSSRGLSASLWAANVGNALDVNVSYKYYASVTLDTANACLEWGGWDGRTSWSGAGPCW